MHKDSSFVHASCTQAAFRHRSARLTTGSTIPARLGKRSMDANYHLGHRADGGEPVALTSDERRRHVEIVGKTGTGKSTLLQSMMTADFASGRRFSFIDPHGDQAAAIADATPRARIDDVIYLDAADLSYSIGWNPLERIEPDRRAVVAAQIAQSFAGIWNLSTAETPRLLYILDKALRLLLDNPADPRAGHVRGATLLDLPRLLIDDDYRAHLRTRCRDQTVRDFWQDEFAAYNRRFRQEAIAPIQNKIGQLVGNPFIRAVIGQPKSTIDIRRIMDGGKILIVNLSKGRMGAEPAHLLGALLVSAFAQAAETRADLPQHERRDFTLYVDEFHNFATGSFADILSEARKWGLAFGTRPPAPRPVATLPPASVARQRRHADRLPHRRRGCRLAGDGFRPPQADHYCRSADRAFLRAWHPHPCGPDGNAGTSGLDRGQRRQPLLPHADRETGSGGRTTRRRTRSHPSAARPAAGIH
jgi:hypothetical protein